MQYKYCRIFEKFKSWKSRLNKRNPPLNGKRFGKWKAHRQCTISGNFWFNIVYVKEFTLFCSEICVSYYY